MARELGMEAYNYFDPNEPETSEPVLIGSYGYTTRPIVRITDALYQTLTKPGDAIDLKYHENKHLVKLSK